VTLDVHLVLFEPAEIQLLSARATLELASDVFLVVTDNPGLSASGTCPRVMVVRTL